jgi:hypothetical protein
LKVSRYIHQEALASYHVFDGGDHDLLFVPINHNYALLVAGDELVREDNVQDTIASLLAVRDEVERALKSMGVTGELKPPPDAHAETPPLPDRKKGKTKELVPPVVPPAPEMEALLKDATKKKTEAKEVDAFWDEAAEKHGTTPTNPEVITYDQARQLGIIKNEENQ